MDINSDIKGIESVSFLPWVGKNYEYGIKGYTEHGVIYGTEDDPGKRILVLGESHYCADPNDATEDLTLKIINDFVDSESEHEPYKNTYIKFERALAGRAIDEEERKKLWSHLMFYNYVQTPMGESRISPNNVDFKNKEKAFWDILNRYKPELIIVWGKRLYNNLPKTGKLGPVLELDEGGYETETWIYNNQEYNTTCLPITHPSSGFSWEFWNEFITKYFKL